MFNDASNTLNVDLFRERELKVIYSKIDDKVNGKVSFDGLYKVVGPILEKQLID